MKSRPDNTDCIITTGFVILAWALIGLAYAVARNYH